MNEIKMKRGGRDVRFRKVDTHFAVRLRQGRARDERALAASCGPSKSEVVHVESTASEKMDIFRVKESSKLEETMGDLRRAPASEVVTHLYAMDDTPGGATIPTGTMTLQFKPEVAEEKREEVLAEFGLEVVEELDFVPNGYTVRLTSASKENPLKIAATLQQRKEMVTAEPDLAFQVTRAHVPGDSQYSMQWHLKNRGDGVGLTAGADAKAEQAWDITRGSRDIIVCVMDDGFDLEHPDFASPGKIVSPRDFGQNDFEPLPGTADDNHGTACAGVAVADENGTGCVGLAPGCAFMPVRTSNWLSDTDIRDLFQHAIDHHADVISCSWSASAAYFPLSTVMNGIIHKAAAEGRSNGKGCVILFAAGNENYPLNGTKNGVNSLNGFAVHPDVIAVGASNSLDKRSDYSNYGPELALCAPSSGSPGRRVVTTDRRGAEGYSTTDYADDFGGTSSATPLSAGLAALILSVDPTLTSAQVRTIMMDTADKIDQTGGQYANGHSPLYGHGRINAQKAVARTAGTGTNAPFKMMTLTHRVERPIPDLDHIEEALSFPIEVNAKSIEVKVDIRHTYRGDLQIGLISPRNETVVLMDRTGGGADDIVTTFRSSDDPARFAALIGKSAKGNWKLKVADMAKDDTGALKEWSIGVEY
ncbi:MAG: S8 family serine peptidase [Planctomycetota bacterium]